MKTSEVTPEQIEKWKEKYGKNNLKMIEIPLDEKSTESLTVYARVPDLRILSEWEKFSDKDPQRSKEILVTNCILTEDDVIKADRDLFLSAVTAIGTLIPIRKAIIKNC